MVIEVKGRVITEESVALETHLTCKNESPRVMAYFDRIEPLYLSGFEI